MEREQHLAWLAVGIGEWSAALTHLDALKTAGHEVPDMTWIQVAVDLDGLCHRWALANGWGSFTPSVDSPRAVADAREWATTHLSLIEDVTNRKGATHDPTTATGGG